MVIIEKERQVIDPKTADWTTLKEFTIRATAEESDIVTERLHFLQGDLEKMGLTVRSWKPEPERQPKAGSTRSRKAGREVFGS